MIGTTWTDDASDDFKADTAPNGTTWVRLAHPGAAGVRHPATVRRLALLVLVTPALLTACFSEHTAPTTGGEGVSVGNIFFRSNHNGSANPAVDTVAPGTTITWTWSSGTTPHSVQSLGSPSFPSSAVLTGDGPTYSFTFTAPGTYQYNCLVHGNLMTGTMVVR
jgi:plastocyanin